MPLKTLTFRSSPDGAACMRFTSAVAAEWVLRRRTWATYFLRRFVRLIQYLIFPVPRCKPRTWHALIPVCVSWFLFLCR